MSLLPHQIILEHINTERTARLRSINNEYVFRVDARSNKYSVKSAVESVFQVKVDSVRTAIVPGKSRRLSWGRPEGRTSKWKKAIVRLKKDQVIKMFENV